MVLASMFVAPVIFPLGRLISGIAEQRQVKPNSWFVPERQT